MSLKHCKLFIYLSLFYIHDTLISFAWHLNNTASKLRKSQGPLEATTYTTPNHVVNDHPATVQGGAHVEVAS